MGIGIPQNDPCAAAVSTRQTPNISADEVEPNHHASSSTNPSQHENIHNRPLHATTVSTLRTTFSHYLAHVTAITWTERSGTNVLPGYWQVIPLQSKQDDVASQQPPLVSLQQEFGLPPPAVPTAPQAVPATASPQEYSAFVQATTNNQSQNNSLLPQAIRIHEDCFEEQASINDETGDVISSLKAATSEIQDFLTTQPGTEAVAMVTTDGYELPEENTAEEDHAPSTSRIARCMAAARSALQRRQQGALDQPRSPSPATTVNYASQPEQTAAEGVRDTEPRASQDRRNNAAIRQALAARPFTAPNMQQQIVPGAKAKRRPGRPPKTARAEGNEPYSADSQASEVLPHVPQLPPPLPQLQTAEQEAPADLANGTRAAQASTLAATDTERAEVHIQAGRVMLIDDDDSDQQDNTASTTANC
eukprot:6466794-Amphidinium_carterae.1